MPSWVAAGDPPYGIWMTHTPQGSINDNLSGRRRRRCTRSTRTAATRSTCTRTAARTSTRSTTSATTACSGTAGRPTSDLGSRIWNKGGLEKYPPIIARGVLLDVAGMHGVDCLPEALRDHAEGPPGQRSRKQGVELRKKDVVLVRTGRMTRLARLRRLPRRARPGSRSPSAKWLCEEAGAMCIAGDTIGLEVLPSEEPDVVPARPRLHVRDRGRADHRGRRHGGDRGREAVRVRVPRLPAEAARRDRVRRCRRTRCR